MTCVFEVSGLESTGRNIRGSRIEIVGNLRVWAGKATSKSEQASCLLIGAQQDAGRMREAGMAVLADGKAQHAAGSGECRRLPVRPGRDRRFKSYRYSISANEATTKRLSISTFDALV